MKDERRRWPRFIMGLLGHGGVVVEVDGRSADVKVEDVSPGGARMRLPAGVCAAVGAKVVFAGGSGDTARVLDGISGTVRWVDAPSRVAGVLFDKPLELTNAELLEIFGN